LRRRIDLERTTRETLPLHTFLITGFGSSSETIWLRFNTPASAQATLPPLIQMERGENRQMYFYHEGLHDPYYADAALEDLRTRDRRVDDRTYEPIRIPAILNWLAIVTIALCVIVAAIQILS